MSLKLCVILSLSLFLGFACTNISENNKKENNILITDVLGRKISVPDSVDKVVGLRAGALRLLLYMDALDNIAGVEETESRSEKIYTNAFPEIKNMKIIGPSMGGDAELIMESGARVIFVTYSTVEDADALQNKTGIPVVTLSCPEFALERDQLYKSFKIIAKILDKENRADSLISFIDSEIKSLNKRTEGIPREEKKSVYVGGVSYSGSHGISSTQPYYPPFLFINANSPASELTDDLISHVKGTFIDVEKIMMWNPDIIFIDSAGIAKVKADFAMHNNMFNDLKAVQNDSIFSLLPYNNYSVNYEHVLMNSWICGKIIFPDEFKDVNINEKLNEITLNFFNKKDLFRNINVGRRIRKEELYGK